MTFETLPVGHAFRFHEGNYPAGVFVKVTPRKAREQNTGRDYPISNFTRVASLGPTDLAGGAVRGLVGISDVKKAVEDVEKAIEDAESWEGWDWAHDPGGIVVDGPGNVGSEKAWDRWERARSRELREDGEGDAEDIAAAERSYGEDAQDAADGAADNARRALKALRDGDFAAAVEYAEDASRAEYDYGDDPAYGPVLKAVIKAAAVGEALRERRRR